MTPETGLSVSPQLDSAGFVSRPTNWASVAQGLFKVAPGADTPGIPKNASGPVGIPLKRSTSGVRR